jgi:hypothetical protein
MGPAKCFRSKKPDVVFELFEDEIILINLGNGNYYSLQGTAAEIWNSIESGLSGEATADLLFRLYRGGRDEIKIAVDQFLAELVEEDLIEPAESACASRSSKPERARPPEDGTGRPPFIAPSLQRYTDMQDLLLLDPIHDVNDQGWPNRRPDKSPAEE